MREGFDETAAAGGEDRIGALPDALLQHVLSFLPSREAVRTCVLARRWRYQWKSVPALRITDAHTYESAQHLNKFVNYLIVLRDRSPLHECEIKSYDEGSDDDERFQYTELWIRYALSCQVRVLRVHTFAPDQYFELPNAPLLSRHLTRLELEGVELMFFSLDFSSCPALEMLKMNDCHFASSDISSPSLQWLSITDYSFGDSNSNIRTLISVPSLIYLELDGGSGRVPFLNSMPSLVTARVRLDDSSDDICDNGNYNGCDDDTCHACDGLHDYGCVLLNNLSGATNLELIADPEVFIFRKDLKWCPTFSKLKTLLLNEWCVEPEFGTLVYFLQHSPILEKLTLQLNKTRQPVVETDEGYSPTEQLLVLKHLRVVEIKCHKEDEWVHKILKILSTYGVPPEQINIQQNFRSSESFTSDSEQLDSEQSDSAQSDSAQSDSEQSDAEQSD